MNRTETQALPSVIHGIPLDEEQGLGALTLPGYLREVTTRYAQREALVMHEATGTTRWSYTELWAQSMAVARALNACGIGKDERVGVMLTNRPEWLSGCFGASLAAGVATGISTFSTPAELDSLLRSSGVSVLLFERTVVKKDFLKILFELEPNLASSAPGKLQSTRSEERRVGKECVGTCRSRWSTQHEKKNNKRAKLRVETTTDNSRKKRQR